MDTKFKETKIGLIPEEWEVKHVKDTANLGRGRVISHNDIAKNPGPYPVYSSQSKGEGSIGSLDTYDFEGEYITWTTDGAYAGSVFYRNGRFNCTNVCGTIQLKVHDTDYQFLSYFLKRVAKKYVTYNGNPKLMNNEFARILVAIPPLPEQHKIADILSTVDEAIDETDAIIQQTQQLKKGLMQKLFTEGIGHTKFKETKIGQIPNDWREQELAGIINITNGFPAESIYFNKENIGIPLIRIRDIPGQLTEVHYNGEFPQEYIVKKGDLLVTMDGKFLATKWRGDDALLNQRVCKVGTKSPNILNQEYLFYYINIPLRKIEQRTGATTVKHLSTKDINRIRVALPTLPEQRKIAEILSKVDTKIETEQAYKTELEQLKQGLMQVLLTGRVRVKV
ncbi:restriction endonuclease subunit S [Chloroflexota bacterium]